MDSISNDDRHQQSIPDRSTPSFWYIIPTVCRVGEEAGGVPAPRGVHSPEPAVPQIPPQHPGERAPCPRARICVWVESSSQDKKDSGVA